MIYLFVGFLAPAILFLILGLFACLKKSSRYDDKDYQSIYSTEENVRIRMPVYNQNNSTGYQMIYENPHFIDYKRPPTYKEAVHQYPKPPSRHLPPNQPRILEKGAVPHQQQHQQATVIY